VDLSFDEGVVSIETKAFEFCGNLRTVSFPASLEVIGESAFSSCDSLGNLTFAEGSQLRCIQKEAFAYIPLKKVILPATVKEIDPSAFTHEAWRSLQSPLLVTGGFLFSRDSHILLGNLSLAKSVVIPAVVEVIAAGAFYISYNLEVLTFARTEGIAPELREIGEAAFAQCKSIKAFTVPSSVVTIGDRCFEQCLVLTTITFEDASRLRKIGRCAFAKSGLTSITIPASTQEIDGSAFLGCPLETIRVAPESQHFVVEGNLLLTANGTVIVRYFGREPRMIVSKHVEVFGESCFESCDMVEQIVFEEESKLRRICKSALSACHSLKSISIPASVEEIEDAAFKDCTELESCEIPENSILGRIGKEAFCRCQSLASFSLPRSVTIIGEKCFRMCRGLESCKLDENADLKLIGPEAFSECRVLTSFYLPDSVEVIFDDCFRKCCSLYRLVFGSGESLNKFVSNSTLDEALGKVGFDEISIVFGIEIDDRGVSFEFPGWSWIADENSRLTLVPYIP
jgi:hypothetical protein